MNEKKQKVSIFEKFTFLKKLKNIKHIEIILLCIFAFILIFIYSSYKKKNSNVQNVNYDEFSASVYAEYLENKLCNLLANINGAGDIKVMITLDGGLKYEYAKENESITTSNEIGGNTNTKTTDKDEVVMVTINGKTQPLIIKQSYPEIIGVVVVSSGANNAQVKLNLMRAVETLLNISDTKIEILIGKS